MNESKSKKVIRKQITKKRALLKPDFSDYAAQNIVKHFVDSEWIQKAHSISCYFPMNSELDTRPLIKVLWEKNKMCYLPVLRENRFLQFAPYFPNTVMKPNCYGILEPDIEKAELLAAEDLDIALLPMVAFDRYGARLGMGGGYYDQTFSFLLENKCQKPKLIGLGFHMQEVEKLPVDDWDVPLEFIITEDGIKNCIKTSEVL